MNKNNYGFIINNDNVILYDFIHDNEYRELIMYELIGFYKNSIFVIRHTPYVLNDNKLSDEELIKENNILEFLNKRKSSNLGVNVKEAYLQLDNSKDGFHFDDELKSVYKITDEVEEKIINILFNRTMNILSKEYGNMIRKLNFGGK